MKIHLLLMNIMFDKLDLSNKTVVVIDVLRSSTSICAALQSNARAVIPVEEPGEAGDLLAKIGGENAVLAGERNGVKIDNFQLGNSPFEFTPQSVGNKFVIMTTTNGTAPFVRSSKAAEVISCGLVNVNKAAEKVANFNGDIVVVCSGRDGQFSIEDTICGGMLIDLLINKYNKEVILNDAGNLALLLYNNNRDMIVYAIEQGEHGQFLQSIGFGEDVRLASEINSIPVLPVLRDGRLILNEN